MNISTLLSTEERIKILTHILYKKEALYISKVADELKLSKGLVSKFFRILTKEKILERSDNEFFVNENLLTRSLKIFLNLNSLNLLKIVKKHKFVKGVGFYGSFVRGTNTEESDIDIWLLIEKVSEEKIAKLTNELKRVSEKIKPLYLTREKVENLKREDRVFYHSLVFGSINICGEEIEAV